MIPRMGVVSMMGLSTLLWFQSTTNTTGCAQSQPQPKIISTGDIVGAFVGVGAVVVGTVVLVHVHDVHTTIKGCVYAGPDGLSVVNEQNQKTYMLSGVTADAKVGDRIKARGKREKKVKGGPDDVFEISKMSKDYGACKVPVVSPSAAGAAKS